MAIARMPQLKDITSYSPARSGSSSSRQSKLDMKDPEVLSQLLKLVGNKEPEKPKANFLEWLLAVPSAIGSIPDAYLDSQRNGSNILGEYLNNLKGGVETLITRDRGEKLKSFSDILDDKGVLQGEGAGEKLLKGVLGFAGDVATDPITYLSFGTGSLLKKGAASAATGVVDDVARKSAASTLKEVLFGQGDDVMKFLGKEVTSNPAIVQAAKIATNPIGSIAGAGFRGAKAIAPEQIQGITDTFNKLFNRKGFEASKGLSKLGESTDEYVKGTRAVDRFVTSEQDALYKKLTKLSPEDQNIFAQIYEGTMKSPDEDVLQKLGITGVLDTTKDNLITGSTTSKWNSMLEQITNNLKGDDQKVALQALANIIPQTDPLGKTIGRMIERTYGIKANPDSLSGLVEEVRSRIRPGQDLLKETNILPGQPNLAEMTDQLKLGEDIPGLLEKANQRPDYFKRTVEGYTDKFIKNNFGENAKFVLDNPQAQRDMAKLGHVSVDTVKNIIDGNPSLAASIKGFRDPISQLGDSGLERTFKTLKEGEEAGVIYNKDIGSLFLQSVANPQKAKIAYDFGQGLSNITRDDGTKLFYSVDEAMKAFDGNIPPGFKSFEIPKVGKFVAPNEAVDVLKNYTTDFIGDEGTNNLVKIYDDFLAFFKSSVTTKSPGTIGFNIRNAIGDMQNMIAGGWRNRGNSLGMAKKALEYEQLMKAQGKAAALAKYGDEVANLYEQGIRMGVVGTSSIDDIARRSGLAAKSQAETLLDKLDTATDKIFQVDLQKQREELFRFANLFDAFKRTNSWTEAGKIARLSSLDYSNLTAFEKNVMRRIIPFYSFMRQNLELQLNVLNKTPGVFMAQKRFYDNLRGVLEDNSATEEDYANLPEWMKEGVYAITGKKGSVADVLTGFGDPQSALNNVLGSDLTKTLQNLLGSSSPLLRMPIEAATGKDLFANEDINERKPGEAYKNMPEEIKNFLDYKEVKRTTKDGKEFIERTISGRAAYLLQNIPVLSPLLTQGKRVAQATEDPKYLLNVFSGGRIYERNLDTEKLRKERGQLRQLQAQLEEAGLGKSFETFYIPKEERAQLLALLGG